MEETGRAAADRGCSISDDYATAKAVLIITASMDTGLHVIWRKGRKQEITIGAERTIRKHE